MMGRATQFFGAQSVSLCPIVKRVVKAILRHVFQPRQFPPPNVEVLAVLLGYHK